MAMLANSSLNIPPQCATDTSLAYKFELHKVQLGNIRVLYQIANSYWLVYKNAFGTNGTDNSRQTGGQTAQIAWVLDEVFQQHVMIHILEIKLDSLAVCVSAIFNVTDRWVITVA